MKKLVASILLLLYSTANFGVSLRLDFCGSSIYDFALFSTEKNYSECCLMMDSDKNCCESEQVYLQETSDKIQLATASPVVSLDCILLPTPSFGPDFTLAPRKKAIFPEVNAPPLKQCRQVLYACFLI